MASTTTGPPPAPAPPTSLRRRAAMVTVFSVMAMIGGLVSVAVVADGREVSQASSNDGGAWLVNRELGVVGHRNRAAGELSAFMRISDSPAAEIHQARDVVVVHDPTTQLLHEVDARTFNEDLEPTQLPALAAVHALDGAVVVVQPDPLRIWRVPSDVLPRLSSLRDVEPSLALDTSAHVAAATDGRVVVVDDTNRQVHWLLPDGQVSAPIDVFLPAPVQAVTIVEASAVLLTEAGDIVVVGPDRVEHELLWATVGGTNPQPTVLQQPSATISSHELQPATGLVAMSVDGDIVEVTLTAVPTIAVRATLGGSAPLAPIVHAGCVYAVVTAPALLAVACEQVRTRRLDGAGPELRLRLVNGWVWVNDLSDGGTWVTNDLDDFLLLDDWGLAEQGLLEEEDQDEAPSSLSVAADRTQFADADAAGPVQDSDHFDPAEPNVAPVAVDDVARTRLDRAAVVPVLANDIDVNNDILIIGEVALLSGQARVDITPTGDRIQVTPTPGFVGVVEIEYWISDGRSAPVSAFVRVEVVAIDAANAAPVTATDVVATAPGHATTIDVLLNDIDPDGDALALVSIEADSGTLRWSPNGQVTFTPDTTTAAGWIELAYVVADDLGAESPGVIRVEIRDLNANQEPDARNDQARTVAGRPAVLNLLDNDSDPDGDLLVVASRPVLLVPENAQVEMTSTSDGEFVFTADLPGTYLLSYSITDSAQGGSEIDSARIRIDVLPATTNSPPVAVRDDLVLAAGESQIVYVLENDGDVDGDVISIVDWQSSPGLRITEFADRSGHVGFRVAAAPDAPSRARFTYAISDGRSAPVFAPVVVTVINRLPSNQPPIANDDVIEIRAGSTVEGIEVLANDFDPEGGPLRVVAIGLPGGSPGVAQASIGLDARTVHVTAPDSATSSFTFSYDIEDDAGNRAGAVVQVQLLAAEAANRPPTARVDDVRTVQAIPVDIDALANDDDPDGDPIAMQGVVQQPDNGSAFVANNGLIRYRPDPDFTGTDVIRYAIVDRDGARAVGDIFIGVTPREEFNEPPVANDDSYALAGASVLTPLDVLANDFDPEDDPIRVVDLTAVSHGIVAIDEFGRVQFGPPPRLAEPTTITFGYTIADNAGNRADAVVAIEMPAFDTPLPTPEPTPVVAPSPTPAVTPTPAATTEPEPTPEPTPGVDPENQPPVAVSDDVGPIAAGSSVIVDVLANDFDPDGEPGELTVVSVAAGGQRNGGFVEVQAGDETLQITYTIADADGAEDSAIITVLVNANRPPQVEPRTVEVEFESSVELDLSGQASDPDGDALFFVCCDSIRGGSISNVETGEGTLGLVFTPNQGFIGRGGFAYSVDDQQGHQVAGSVTVVVGAPDNRPPVALDNTVDVPQGATVSIDLAELASDPDGDDLTWSLRDVPSDIKLEVSLDGAIALATANAVLNVGDLSSFTYQVSDGPQTAVGRVDLVITSGANEPPTATGLSVELAAGSSTTINLEDLTSDPDVGEQLVFELLSVSNPGGLGVTLNGSLVQVAAPVASTNAQTLIEYQVTDRRGETASAVLAVSVNAPTAPPPTAVDDQAGAQEGVPVTIDVLANDVDPLGQGLTIVGATAVDGTVEIANNALRFTATEITGSLAIQYTIEDAAGRQASATVIVDTVGPPERPAPPQVVAASEQVTISWTTPQARGAAITGYVVTSPVAGTRTLGIENSLTWTGLTNGTDYTFTVRALSSAGPSQDSEPSLPVTPDELPGRPSPPSVEFGDGYLDVVWEAPKNDGTDIVGYELEIGGTLSEVVSTGTATEFSWTGLSNGQAYTFRVRAQNGAGFGPFSSPSAAEFPVGLAGAPVIGTAQRGNLSGSLIVSWSPPINDNGGDITNYRVVPSRGAAAEIGSNDTMYNWSNLQNGVAMTFQVQAENRAGWGPLSAASNSVAPCGVPDGPTINSVRRLDQAVRILLDQPADNGCAITGYIVTSTDGQVQQITSTSLDFGGLTNGQAYSFDARAINEMGTSVASQPSSSVTPAGPPICAGSSGVTATATGPGQVTLSWTAAIDNGDPLVSYTIQYSGISIERPPLTGTVIDGLANATSYTFSVLATNTVGSSPSCGSAATTTWSPPTPLQANKSFDPDLDALSATVTGGASPSNPITSWTAHFEHGSTMDQTWSGVTDPPALFSMAVVEDGNYGFYHQVCNAVGCVEVNSCCEQITLAGPPEVMDAPLLRYEWPSWDRFGVDVFVTFTPPADDGGSAITSYEWQSRYMGASGNWNNDSGVSATPDEFAVGFWSGYSSYPFGTNQGQTITWEVRVAAVNDEGQADWSEWGAITPAMRDPHVVLTEFNYLPDCFNEPELGVEFDCSEAFLEVHGLGGNRTYAVDISPDAPMGCVAPSITTDGSGSFGGVVSGCTYFWDGTSLLLTAAVDGVVSPPARFGGGSS